MGRAIVVAALVVGIAGGVAGTRWWDGRGTVAAGTWQSVRFADVFAWNSASGSPDPARHLNDWAATLPTSCDIEAVVIPDYDVIALYRCP
jgi:hypothetical protein